MTHPTLPSARARRHTLPLCAGLLAAGLALTGCGSSTTAGSGMNDMGSMTASTPSATPAPSASGPHNQADVTFAQQMVPHHQQAVEMSRTLLAKTGIDPQVTALAREIEAAQAPEIATMTGWLTGWGAAPMTGMGTSMSGSMNDGMMSDADMSALEAAQGTEATKLYLTGMISHHRGAVAMARTELTAGSNAQAKALAQSIITTQQREITTMTELLKS